MKLRRSGSQKRLLPALTRAVAMAVLPVILFSSVSCNSPTTKEPLKLGFIGSLSGKFATMGVTARDGAILAVEELNSTGGICGRAVELIIKDDAGDPSSAVTQVNTLSDLGVRYLIGPLTSSSGAAILPVINQKGILTISPTTTSAALADKKDLFIKFSPNATQYGKMIGMEAHNQAGYEGSPVAVYDSRNERFCTSFMEGLDKSYRDVGRSEIPRIAFNSSKQVSYRELAMKILELSPSDVVFCSSSLDTAVISQHLKRGDPGIELYSTEWAISPSLVESGGKCVEGLIFYSVMDFSDRSQNNQDFRNSYKNRFGTDPTLAAMSYYETVNVLSETFNADCRVSDPVSMVKTITGMDLFSGVQRDFRFDREGDAIIPLMKHVIRDGQFIRIPDSE